MNSAMRFFKPTGITLQIFGLLVLFLLTPLVSPFVLHEFIGGLYRFSSLFP